MVIKETPRNSKSIRLEQLQPYFAQGKFHLLKDMQALKDELLLFPRGKHDDIMDAVWTALDGHKPSRKKNYKKVDENHKKDKKVIDWMTL